MVVLSDGPVAVVLCSSCGPDLWSSYGRVWSVQAPRSRSRRPAPRPPSSSALLTSAFAMRCPGLRLSQHAFAMRCSTPNHPRF
eukprot:3578133-Rhodomonas_salina.1